MRIDVFTGWWLVYSHIFHRDYSLQLGSIKHIQGQSTNFTNPQEAYPSNRLALNDFNVSNSTTFIFDNKAIRTAILERQLRLSIECDHSCHRETRLLVACQFARWRRRHCLHSTSLHKEYVIPAKWLFDVSSSHFAEFIYRT
jgi:hypothetical protein